MTNQEINEAVAKRLGWKFKTDDVSGNHWHKDGYCYDEIPDYCSDIAAAWKIPEHLKATKYHCVQLNANVFNQQYGFWIGTIYKQEVFGESDTAPMAICKAFLKLEEPK